MALCRFVPRLCRGIGPCSPQTAALYVARAVNELQGMCPGSVPHSTADLGRYCIDDAEMLRMCFTFRRQQSAGKELLAVLGPDRLTLVEERLELGNRELCLIEPLDLDAVMDMYIKRGVHAQQVLCASPVSPAAHPPMHCS